MPFSGLQIIDHMKKCCMMSVIVDKYEMDRGETMIEKCVTNKV